MPDQFDPIDYINLSSDLHVTRFPDDETAGIIPGVRTVELSRAGTWTRVTFVETDEPADPDDPETVHLTRDGFETLLSLVAYRLAPDDVRSDRHAPAGPSPAGT